MEGYEVTGQWREFSDEIHLQNDNGTVVTNSLQIFLKFNIYIPNSMKTLKKS